MGHQSTNFISRHRATQHNQVVPWFQVELQEWMWLHGARVQDPWPPLEEWEGQLSKWFLVSKCMHSQAHNLGTARLAVNQGHNQAGNQPDYNHASSQPGTQPDYNQAPTQYQSTPGSMQTTNLPGSYADSASLTGQGYQQPLQYNPTASPQNSLPSQGAMSMNQGYNAPVPPGPNIDYQAFNMQGMANALPPQTQQQMYNAHQPPQYMGGAPQGQYQQGVVPSQQMAPGPQPSATQGPPPVQQQTEGKLISFD